MQPLFNSIRTELLIFFSAGISINWLIFGNISIFTPSWNVNWMQAKNTLKWHIQYIKSNELRNWIWDHFFSLQIKIHKNTQIYFKIWIDLGVCILCEQILLTRFDSNRINTCFYSLKCSFCFEVCHICISYRVKKMQNYCEKTCKTHFDVEIVKLRIFH